MNVKPPIAAAKVTPVIAFAAVQAAIPSGMQLSALVLPTKLPVIAPMAPIFPTMILQLDTPPQVAAVPAMTAKSSQSPRSMPELCVSLVEILFQNVIGSDDGSTDGLEIGLLNGLTLGLSEDK